MNDCGLLPPPLHLWLRLTFKKLPFRPRLHLQRHFSSLTDPPFFFRNETLKLNGFLLGRQVESRFPRCHEWPQTVILPPPISFTESHLRPGGGTQVRTVTGSLFWSLCLTGGFVLHVWWVLLCAAQPGLLTFLPGSEGLTVPLALDEGEPASPWPMLFYSRWQLWQLVMAAGWWESQAFLPLAELPQPSAPDRCFTWRT